MFKPIPDADFEAIQQAFWKYAVLVFPGKNLTPDQHLEFSARFGPVEKERTLAPKATPTRYSGAFADISNLDAQGKIWGESSRRRTYRASNKLWHTDSSFKHLPSLCSLLYSRTIAPIGGHTQFADQRAAYDAPPDADDTKKKNCTAGSPNIALRIRDCAAASPNSTKTKNAVCRCSRCNLRSYVATLAGAVVNNHLPTPTLCEARGYEASKCIRRSTRWEWRN